MYKAVFVDLDGTLLQPDFTVAPSDARVLKYLQAKEVMIVPVSARPLHGITPITQSLLPTHSPLISLNGSYIYNNEQVILDVTMQLDYLESIHFLLRSFPVSAMYYSGMKWFAESLSPLVQKEQRITVVPIQIQPFDQTMQYWKTKKRGPNKILVGGAETVILELQERLRNLYSDQLNIYCSHPNYLEVLNKAASKTIAMQQLMQLYGIAQSETIAIGDNYNDQEMIEFAGVGVAMGSAPQPIKEIAAYVTATNINNGVGKALAHLFHLPGFFPG